MPFACFIEIYHWRVELIHAFFCGFTWYFVQKMNLLCYIYYAIGQSFIDVNGQILNRYLNNLDIWSHCQRSRFSRQTVSRFSLFNQRDRLRRPKLYLSISKWRDKANVTSLTHFLLKIILAHPKIGDRMYDCLAGSIWKVLTLEHSLLGEVSLYGWSPVLQVWIRLLHYIQKTIIFLGQVQSC